MARQQNILRSIPNENHSFRIIQCQTDYLLFNLITYFFQHIFVNSDEYSRIINQCQIMLISLRLLIYFVIEL